MGHPCATNPELWFGYPDDDGGDGAAKARVTNARPSRPGFNACAAARWRNNGSAPNAPSRTGRNTVSGPGSNCPAASTASANSSPTPTRCLRRIAAGEINARELPDNAALLARRECDRESNKVPVSAVVLHLPAAQLGPRSAA